MRCHLISPEGVTALGGWPDQLPEKGFVWIALARAELEPTEQRQGGVMAQLQSQLQMWRLGALVDLHVSDLCNAQLRSQYDDTSWYDLVVFRRLSLTAQAQTQDFKEQAPSLRMRRQSPMLSQESDRLLQAIDTSPVGFAVFDHLLISVHPDDCTLTDTFARRLSDMAKDTEARGGSRLPTSATDLMLRMLNHMVDSYLELRRMLTGILGHIEQQLFNTDSRFNNWQALLTARNALHLLEDTCEDQRSAMAEWLDAFEEWPNAPDTQSEKERDLLRVRARDVQEHIERVLTHVRRLQSSAESAVQIHLSALGNRTNDIMRTLTVLTAIFLPLNLVTGFFGMNFDWLPLIHSAVGFWAVATLMLVLGGGLSVFFWRKRYLGTRARR